MKKVLVLLLCTLFVVAAFSSCADNNGNDTNPVESKPETGAPVETEDPNYVIDLPDVKYEGYTFTILANSGFWAADDIFREEDSEDPVDSAIYKREANLKEKYGFDVEVVEDSNVNKTIQDADKAGISDYDIAVFCAYEAAPLASSGIFTDLTSVETLNLDKYYWDQNLRSGLSIDNKLFYITGDISTKANAGTFLMLFNKNIAANLDYPNLYDVVRNGEWTIDYLNELIKNSYVDDGDSKVGITDTFGLGIQIEAYLAFYFGCAGVIVGKDTEDLPYLNLNNAKNIAIIDKVYDLTRLDNKTIDSHEWLNEMNNGFISVKAFQEGKATFILTNAANIASFREMDSDFGVLPVPKYEKAQESYYSYVYHGASLYVIPRNNKQVEFTGFALEAMAYESYKLLTPAYYEQTLKGKYQRDADSFEMMDIAFRNRVWDLGYFARFGGLDDRFIGQIKKGTSSFASFYKSASKAAEKAITKYIETYKKSGE